MKRTPLYENHKELGARMVEFGGWEMPVQYSGIKQEHLAVRQKAGLFDISHMGEIEIRGVRALEQLQRLTPNDVSRLQPGRSQYSALLTEQGTFVDDIMVYCLGPDHYLLCVNASNTEKDFKWIQAQLSAGAEALNRSDAWGLLALQGPIARSILPSDLKKNYFEKTSLAGAEVLLSATGYTGEDGFEIFCPREATPPIWTHLLQQGTKRGLIPCGLGARDTLRLEASYPLYGHEIDDQTTPLEAGLAWIVKKEKGDFIGKTGLSAPLKKRLIGLKLLEPGIARQGYKLFDQDREVGIITSGTLSPTLGEAVAMAYLTPPLTNEPITGRKIQVDIRGKKKEAKVVPLPFYKRL